MCAPQNRADPQDELAWAERLGDVVVSAEFEPDHAVALLATGGQHDDRYGCDLPDPPADLQSGHPREHEVENGSYDGSAELARQLGATVISVPTPGYGAACHAGVVAATSPIVCVMDADATLDPQELPDVVRPLLDGEADLVIGRRRPTARG